MHETLPKWVPHLITPELDPINAHGHSDTSQHEGKCDEGEVTEERDTALNWWELNYLCLQILQSHMTMWTFLPTPLGGSWKGLCKWGALNQKLHQLHGESISACELWVPRGLGSPVGFWGPWQSSLLTPSPWTPRLFFCWWNTASAFHTASKIGLWFRSDPVAVCLYLFKRIQNWVTGCWLPQMAWGPGCHDQALPHPSFNDEFGNSFWVLCLSQALGIWRENRRVPALGELTPSTCRAAAIKLWLPTHPVPRKLGFSPCCRAFHRSLTQFHLTRFPPLGRSAKIILDLASAMPCPLSPSWLHVNRECDKPACYVFIAVPDNSAGLPRTRTEPGGTRSFPPGGHRFLN